MTRYFMRDTPLQAMEQLMMSQPGQKPRGGGIYRSPFHYMPKDVACEYCQNYDRKHPCRLCECTCLEERIEAGALKLNEFVRDCFAPSMGPQLRKRMHQQFREKKAQFFLSDAHRRRWTHWRERCWRLSDRNKSALFLLTAYESLWRRMVWKCGNDGFDFQSVRLGGIEPELYSVYQAAKAIAIGCCNITLADLTSPELVTDEAFHLITGALLMAKYGFLTKYIFADGIEEIDINSWRDIEIQYSDGHTAKLEEHFDSLEHAANVIRRMLQNSGRVLDNASPIRERGGRVMDSVVHTQARDSENERQRIDQIALLDIALRFNPDIICVGEMRGPEADAAQEADRVGIAVLTTIHSNSSEGTYRRMVSLCKRAVDTPDDTLMGYVTEAYPIVVYCRQLENKQRRITNISECEILPDGSRRLHKLYEYHITDNHLEGDRFVIEGEHQKCEEISESLRRRFIENGMPLGELAQFVQGKEEDE